MEGLGPFSEIKVVTAGVGPREINELLAQGWTLINVEFHEHVMELGTANQQRVIKMEMLATLGRAIPAAEDASRAREEASEQGESAIAAATIHVPAGVSLSEDDSPLIQNDPPQPAPARTRKIAKGEGDFIATGIRG